MKNLKPSQLPADTVINDAVRGVWMKEESGVWGETVPHCVDPHCVDCARAVRDNGTLEVWVDGENKLLTSDDFFQDFKIVSLPYSIFEALIASVKYWKKEANGSESEDWLILKDAMENSKADEDEES